MNLTSKRENLKKLYVPLGLAIARTGIHPNLITLISLFLGTVSAYFFYNEKVLTAVSFLILSGLFDLIDGVVARETERTSKFGEVFDWVADKWVDGFVLGAVGFAFASPFVATTAVVVSMLHSFIKPVAYAEIGYSERVRGKIKDPLEGIGFFGRPETHLTLITFALLERAHFPLGLNFGIKLVALLTLISLLVRIIYLYKHYGKEYE
ncbi:phosphatidylglycerophosphate synthase [Hydrogenivirga caldilitoris]|uniref:Phosphatidylglycerophosphate synthase n=1 Tax=Hydrogenivirga caldilitoris TaxID=246264 RepID=A0A497XSM0_9AQUI|nr:CDP-alcohol phosphatidyltransferase family protein [Hydrogenivirga caldilitoris]RLJ71099.1 phosphatidylglycerophosphate synthase [Hydrogenivirga caldilitoris]